MVTEGNTNYTIKAFDRGVYLKRDDTNCTNNMTPKDVMIALQNHNGYQEVIVANSNAIRQRGIYWIAISTLKDSCGHIHLQAEAW